MLTAAPAARPAALCLRAARVTDLRHLASFIASYTGDGTLLPRTLGDLMTHCDDFLLAVHRGRIVGCGALHPVEEGLAEIRSLAVDPRWRRLGIGGRILEGLLRRARRKRIARVFCLTRRIGFFERHGFAIVHTSRFPQKVWNDCRLCPRRDRCDETAMERALTLTGESPGSPASRRHDPGSGSRRGRRP